MKPFNLEEARAGKLVVTRDGRKVSQLHLFNLPNEPYPLCGVVDELIFFFDEDGSCGRQDTDEDLFMESDKVTKWVNIYQHSDGERFSTSNLYDTEEIAKAVAQSDYITTASVTFEI